MKYAPLFLSLTMLLSVSISYAQIIIQPQNISGEITIDNLYSVSIINSTPAPINGYLQLKIEDATKKTTFVSQSPLFTIPSGILQLPSSIALSSTKKFGSNSAGILFSSTGKLPAGTFSICYTFLSPGEAGVKGINCREQQIQNVTPPFLLSPYNKEEIATTFPVLVWHPPTPIDPLLVTYSLKLTELKKSQSPAQALKNNLPFLDRSGLPQTQLPYPNSAPALEQTKTYVWQVAAFEGEQSLGITEIWSFKIGEQTQVLRQAPEDDEGFYPRIEDFQTHGYYLTDGKVRFAYDNRGSDTVLAYRITKAENTADNTLADSLIIVQDSAIVDSAYVIPDNPSLHIDYGLNQIYLDLTDWTGWIQDQNYILQVTDANGRVYSLTYLYETEQ